MEKLVYALWRRAAQSPEEIGAELFGDAAAALADGDGVHAVTVYREEPAAAAMRWGEDPRGLVLTAAATMWVDRTEQRAALEAVLASTGAVAAGYVVAESAPLDYVDRTWPDGTVSPGLSLVTFFGRVAGLSDDQLCTFWHGSHTPMTFEIHPFWRYLRNFVARSLDEAAPAFDGIVQEAVERDELLLDLHQLYGAPGDDALLAENIRRITADGRRFIDYTNLQTCPMRELIVRSPPWQQPAVG